METTGMTNQVIGLQKAVFDNAFTGFCIMQDSSHNMLNGFLRQFPWSTEETRKPLNDSMAFVRNVQADYKRMVDQSFAQFQTFFEQK